MNLAERKPVDLYLRRVSGQFALIVLLDSGTELATNLSAAEYLDLRDNEGIRLEDAPHQAMPGVTLHAASDAEENEDE